MQSSLNSVNSELKLWPLDKCWCSKIGSKLKRKFYRKIVLNSSLEIKCFISLFPNKLKKSSYPHSKVTMTFFLLFIINSALFNILSNYKTHVYENCVSLTTLLRLFLYKTLQRRMVQKLLFRLAMCSLGLLFVNDSLLPQLYVRVQSFWDNHYLFLLVRW